jgi:hypothetical protein
MKYLKVFENYQSNEEIISICSRLGIDNYTILDGLVNVNGNVNIAESYHQLQVIYHQIWSCYRLF